jgi:preprotein translocase subunit SecE
VKLATAKAADGTSDLEAITMAEEANLVDSAVQEENDPATEAPAQSARKVAKPHSASPALWQRIVVLRYCYEVYLELRKVTWPTREEAMNMTIVVIVISAVVGILLGLVDLGLSQFVQHIISP